jgi:N-acetyl-S-(2-succino)cysteine monooxygenase
VADAVDGFNVMPPVLPSGLEAFTEHVIPLLRKGPAGRHQRPA